MTRDQRTALVVVDVQRAFDDHDYWSPTGRRDNPDCEANVGRLIAAWRDRREPIVFVRHDSVEDGSPLTPGAPGNAFKDVITGEPDLLVTKSVNSSFLGAPDLAEWLRGAGLERIALCGIQTNHCVETTARMGANLGFDVLFVRDACHTFDREGPDGDVMTAEQLTQATLTSLHDEFATIVRTSDIA
jgi:nicotinamidase-related amidase